MSAKMEAVKPGCDALIAKHGLELSVQHGTVMKEYVQIPAKLFANARVMSRVFAQSVEYAKSLKPKATTRKNASKKSAEKKASKEKSAKRKSSRKKAT